MENKKIRNKINVSADAQFIYEEVLLPIERKMPSWEKALFIVDEVKAVPYITAIRKAKANLARAERAEKMYRGTDTNIHNALREKLESAREEWRKSESDERYSELRHKAFELYDQYEEKYRTLDRRALESEMENYIDRETDKGLLINERYFKKVYYDKQLGVSLLLFLYLEAFEGNTQYWNLAGIMELKDYCEEDEDFGIYRADHLDPLIKQLYNGDWVLKERAKARKYKRLAAEAENERFGVDYLSEIKYLLKNYEKNKIFLAVAVNSVRNAELADKMCFLDKCIENLNENDRHFIIDFIESGSLGKLAKKCNYSKNAINHRLKKALSVVETLFYERYEL